MQPNITSPTTVAVLEATRSETGQEQQPQNGTTSVDPGFWAFIALAVVMLLALTLGCTCRRYRRLVGHLRKLRSQVPENFHRYDSLREATAINYDFEDLLNAGQIIRVVRIARSQNPEYDFSDFPVRYRRTHPQCGRLRSARESRLIVDGLGWPPDDHYLNQDHEHEGSR